MKFMTLGVAGLVLAAGLTMAQAEEGAAPAAAAGTVYEIDGSHSSVGFKVKHMVISKVRGEFRDATATLIVEGGALKSAQATLKAASIDTGIADRDNHLRSPDFLDVATQPEITFKSTGITADKLTGDLTIRGVTKPVELAYTLSEPVNDPWGNTKVGFSASGTINRQDYGLTWNKLLETGAMVVGNDVELLIESEFALEKAE